MYLLDTNVISTLLAQRDSDRPELVTWLRLHDARTFLSVITVAELEAGVAKLRRTGATKKAGRIATWLEALIGLYEPRILAFDLDASRFAGRIQDRARARGQTIGFADVAIAAIAESRRMTMLTRNLRHFRSFGLTVPVLDSFAELPR